MDDGHLEKVAETSALATPCVTSQQANVLVLAYPVVNSCLSCFSAP